MVVQAEKPSTPKTLSQSLLAQPPLRPGRQDHDRRGPGESVLEARTSAAFGRNPKSMSLAEIAEGCPGCCPLAFLSALVPL